VPLVNLVPRFREALLSHSRKTQRVAGLFPTHSAVRAAPFALPAGRGSVFVCSYVPTRGCQPRKFLNL